MTERFEISDRDRAAITTTDKGLIPEDHLVYGQLFTLAGDLLKALEEERARADRQLLRAAELLRAAAYELWSATLSPSPNNRKRMAFMQAPQVGHMVAIHAVGPRKKSIDCVGKLLRHTPPPCWGDDEWVIETLDGREVAWTNVLVLRIPTHLDSLHD